LDTLRQKLFHNDQVRTAALVGLGGVGKTQLALRLAYWVRDNKPEYSIFWVPALSGATFEHACGEIVKKLAIGKSSSDKDPKGLLQHYLSSPEAGKWLLVVDNADDHNLLFGGTSISEGLADYLPESEDGRTLFTTRSRIVAVDAAKSDVVELDKMSPQDAASHLEESLIWKVAVRNSPDAEALLTELEYLPLAITQAAAYLNENQISVVEYLGLLRGAPRDMVSLMSREFRDKTRYKDSRNAVATTWLVSFEQIRTSNSVAADLLAFISRIQPKGIPRSLLPQCESKEEMTRALGTLSAYSFLSNRGENKVFDMHSLVHMATQIWVDQRGLATQEAEKAIRHVSNAFPFGEHENRFLWREYMPHAIKMLEEPEGQDIKERYLLCLGVGYCLFVDGRIKEAVNALEQCHQWRSSEYLEDHPDRLLSQHVLAGAYHLNGQIKEAVDLLKHVVEVEGRVLTEDHLDRLASQHELARAYLSNGQVKEAVDLLNHVVEVQGRVLAEDHLDRLASQHELAGAYHLNGQIKEAVDLLKHVVEVQGRVLAEDHLDRLASQHELARAYLSNGQVKEAVDLLKYIVEVQGRVLAEDHPSRLASQHALAGAYLSNGQIKEAVDLLKHVVEVKGRVLAEDHFNQLASQHELARAYLSNGQVKEAVDLLKHVVEVQRRVLAEDHPDRLASQHALAGAYRSNGQVKEAVDLLKYVVEVEGRVLAEDHPSRLASQHALAIAYMADVQVTRAIGLLENVVKLEAQMYDEGDWRLIPSREALEEAYTTLKREEAGKGKRAGGS